MRPGDRVDRYVVEALIASGKAQVYRVRHEALGTRRALKVQQGLSEATAAACLEEGRVQAQLDHPNLVGVVDVIDVGGAPGLVLEYVEGPTLRTLLQDAPPAPEDAVALFRQVLDGVAHAHRAGLVHRDLKPDNVVLDVSKSPPVARVTDFGVARAARGVGGREGTLGYCAPEQLRGESPSPRADVFALGVLLWELVTGELPYPQLDREQLLAAMTAGRRAALPEDLPAGFAALLDLCLDPEPEARPEDARALLAALRPAGPAALPPRGRGAWPWLVAGLALVSGLLVLRQHGLQEDLAAARIAEEASRLQARASDVRLTDPAASLALSRAVAALRGEDRLGLRQAAGLLHDGAVTTRLDHPTALTVRVALSRDLIALADDRPAVRVLRRDTGAAVVTVDSHITRPGRLSLDEDGRWLVVTPPADPAEAVSPVAAWSLPDGQPVLGVPATPAWSWAPDGAFDRVLTVHDQVSGRRRAEVRQLPGGELLWQADLDAGEIARLGPAGRTVLRPDGTDWVQLAVADGAEVARWPYLPSLPPAGDGWARFGPVLAVMDASGALVGELPAISARRAWASDGSWVGGVDGDERLWAIAAGGTPVEAWPHDAPARAVAGQPGGLLVGTSDGQVHRWTPGGETRARLGLGGRVISMLEHQGTLAASALGGRVAIWEPDVTHVGVASRAREPQRVPLPDAVQGLRRGFARVDGGTLIATTHEVVLVDDDGQVQHTERFSQVGQLEPGPDGTALVTHGATAGFSVLGADGRIRASAHADTDQGLASLTRGDFGTFGGTFCGRLLVFEGAEGRELTRTATPISALAAGEGGVAAGTWGGEVLVVREGEVLWRQALGRQIVDLIWTEGGLVAADGGGGLTWLDPRGEVLAVRQGHAAGKVRLRLADGVLWSHGTDELLLSWDSERIVRQPPTLAHTGSWTNLRVCRADGRGDGGPTGATGRRPGGAGAALARRRERLGPGLRLRRSRRVDCSRWFPSFPRRSR